MFQIATLNKISKKGINHFSDSFQITDAVENANGILVRSQDMQKMDFSENLLAIARAGAGVNNIPTVRCAESGIVVFNTPGANANAVKELVLSGMLNAARNVPDAVAWTKTLSGDIGKTVEKNKSQFAGRELSGKTLGVIGLGAIGAMVANAAEQLGMKVIGYDPYITLHSAHLLSNTIPVTASIDALLPKCDYLTIHVPALDSTKGMINEDKIKLMKNGVTFLNFARDSLVNEDDMLSAIESGKVKKYVTDFPNAKVLNRNGVICTPHLGASTQEAEENCAIMAVEQLMDYLENGNITNSVNYPNCSLGYLQTQARIVVLNKNIPGMLSKITGIIGDMNLNISDMVNRSKGDFACTLVDADSDVDEAELKKALAVEGIVSVRVIHQEK